MKRAAAAFLLMASAPVALAAAPDPGPIIAWTYVVHPGDTALKIARRMGVTVKDLAAANALPYPWIVRIGQTLKRPEPAPRSTLTPKPVVTSKPRLSPRAAPQPRPAPAQRPRPEPLPVHAREAGAPRLGWPTSGAVIARFGVPVRGKPNMGMDLAAFAGMTVNAAAAGRVIFAGQEPERFGQLVVIDHGNGWATAYAYLGKLTVKEGQAVTARQIIARIGSSGEASAPTLHFEVRKDNVPRDPYAYLPVRL